MILENLLDIINMVKRHVENFLRGFEIKWVVIFLARKGMHENAPLDVFGIILKVSVIASMSFAMSRTKRARLNA